MLNPKLLLIVKVKDGLNILDLPRPQSQGAHVRRAAPVGTPLQAYLTINVAGAEYAMLVPLDPQRPEWVRVKDAGMEYVDRFPLEDGNGNSAIADALNRVADALEKLARNA